MKIRTKLTVGFLVIVLLIWTTVFFAVNTYTNIQEEFEALEGDIIPGAIAMAGMEEKAQEIKAWTFLYIVRGNVIRRDKPVKEWLLESTASLEKFAKEHTEHETHIGLEEQKAAEELENNVKQLNSAAMEVISLKNQGMSVDELTGRMLEFFGSVLQPLIIQLEEHKATHMEELAESGEAVHEAHDSGVRVLLLAAGLITLLAATVRFFAVRSIANPLRALHKGTEIIGQGNLDYKVGTKAKDEIGQLSRAFDQMTEDLQKTTTSIDNLNKEITERKRVEQELVEKTREVERANQLKSEFLAGMSHELRTPLNAVIGFSELMLDGIMGEINDEQRGCLGDILDSGQHLLNLINDVLDLSKVEAGKMELKIGNLNLTDVIDDVVQIVKPVADKNRHKIEVSVEEGLPQVRADISRLRQVFLNLLSNATKFTPSGGKLGIEANREGDWCQVSVVDSGIGIKEEDQGKLFEAFTQAETLPGGKKEGTGLGLALTRQFVEVMGGRIWVESEYGKGSRFTFTLPLAREGKPYLAEKKEKLEEGFPKTKEPPLKPGQKRVLVVDDDRRARSLLGSWLKAEGYAITEASSADEGIDKARELLPQVVILDILMPEKDGWHVLQALKSMAKTRDIPIVITSIVEENELAFSQGAVDYFVKPVNKRRFQKRIAELGIARQEKVLVVDDNPADVRLVISILEAEGIGVLCAYGGEEGVRMAKEDKPALIVLDILMPDLNGFEVIEKLHEDEKTRNIPIIILTVKELTEEEFKMLSGRTKAVIMKASFRQEGFLSEVKKVAGLGDE